MAICSFNEDEDVDVDDVVYGYRGAHEACKRETRDLRERVVYIVDMYIYLVYIYYIWYPIPKGQWLLLFTLSSIILCVYVCVLLCCL